MNAHTPTPWTITHHALMGNAADGKPAFHCGVGLRGPSETHIMVANAALIVEAVNSHAANQSKLALLPRLVEALELLSYAYSEHDGLAWQRARALLAELNQPQP